MQSSLFVLLLILAPALGDEDLGIDGLFASTNYHVSASSTSKQKCAIQTHFPLETPEAWYQEWHTECDWRAELEEHPVGGRLQDGHLPRDQPQDVLEGRPVDTQPGGGEEDGDGAVAQDLVPPSWLQLRRQQELYPPQGPGRHQEVVEA